MAHSPQHARSPVRRFQILAIGAVGALTILAFALSLLLGGEAGRMFSSVAGALGIVCAVIGVSFALVGNQR